MPSRTSSRKRCAWVGNDPLYLDYHDLEWGVPVRDDRMLFEMLILEGAQAGLSWITVLKKRENYRRAFDGFDAHKIARYGARKKRTLLNDAGIIRNRLKIDAAIGNAHAFLEIGDEHGSFSDFLWDFVDGRPIVNRWRRLSEVPVSTAKSDALSKALKSRGFKFVGTTICYSFMQAVGMVNDHTRDCFRYSQISRARKFKGVRST
jgi:DNA-3-methyladenine glycosylase I